MSKVRYEFTGRLVTASPLHVGSGQVRTVAAVKGKDGANRAPQVAAIMRCASGRPYLPGTTLKGVLRKIAERMFGETSANDLFGEIKNDDSGKMGLAQVFGSSANPALPDVTAYPYGAASAEPFDNDGCGAGVFVAARTRINPATGLADDNKLFFQEMAGEGTRFPLRILVEGRGDGARLEQVARVLTAVLKRLETEAGIPVGKGQADGMGRLRLDGDVKVVRSHIGADGAWQSKSVSLWQDVTPVETGADGKTLVLHCPGPFVIKDSSHEPDRSQDETTRIQVKAQSGSANLPLVLGSSLTGALRARARWLAAIELLNDPNGGGDAINPLKIDDPDTVVSWKDQVKHLTPVEKLFGVTGYRARLEVRRIEVIEAVEKSFTSVKLDRFIGSPVDEGLFTTQTFVGTRLKIELALRPDADEDVQALYEQLLDDLSSNGITLGHGGAKGFGWYKVENGGEV